MQSQQWLCGAMDTALSLHIEGLGVCLLLGETFFLFFVVILFCFVSFYKKNI